MVDLGQLPRGAVVEFHISGNAANVWLMDSSTYSQYKSGRSVRAQGRPTQPLLRSECKQLVADAGTRSLT